MRPPVTDEISDGDDLQAVFACENQKLWKPRHRAVVVRHFTDYTGGVAARETCEIDGDRGAEAAQPDLHFLIVQRPAIRSDLVQRLPQGSRVDDGVWGEARQAAADQGIEVGVRHMCQQHLPQR